MQSSDTNTRPMNQRSYAIASETNLMRPSPHDSLIVTTYMTDCE